MDSLNPQDNDIEVPDKAFFHKNQPKEEPPAPQEPEALYCDDDDDDYDYPGEAGPSGDRIAVGVLTFLAVAAAGLLIACIVLCLPYLKSEQEDPEEVIQKVHVQEQLEQSESIDAPEESTEPEVTTEPTIPPEVNNLTKYDFQYDRHNYLYCTRQKSYPGVDVSAFQGNIDWQAVAGSGIRFAIIRLGYRGYGQAGTLVEDEYAKKNLENARAAGLSIGAYFFSQATSIQEVDEEIEFLSGILGDTELQMPLVLDWEYISDTARTANVDARTLTDCLKYFCDVMAARGYSPMIYFNWTQSKYRLYLSELEDYPFWLALYQENMTYPWRVDMWQYTCTGRVPGIQGDVDINVYIPDLRAK